MNELKLQKAPRYCFKGFGWENSYTTQDTRKESQRPKNPGCQMEKLAVPTPDRDGPRLDHDEVVGRMIRPMGASPGAALSRLGRRL